MMIKVENNDMSGIAASKVAVVDFNATWCGPCKMLGPVLEELSAEFAGKADFYSLDIDQNEELTSRFGITGVPTVIIFKNGVQADMSVGFKPKPAMQQWIAAQL